MTQFTPGKRLGVCKVYKQGERIADQPSEKSPNATYCLAQADPTKRSKQPLPLQNKGLPAPPALYAI